MIGSMITVGLLPSAFPYDIVYSYDVAENSATKIINTNYKFIKAFGCLIYSDWENFFFKTVGESFY